MVFVVKSGWPCAVGVLQSQPNSETLIEKNNNNKHQCKAYQECILTYTTSTTMFISRHYSAAKLMLIITHDT